MARKVDLKHGNLSAANEGQQSCDFVIFVAAAAVQGGWFRIESSNVIVDAQRSDDASKTISHYAVSTIGKMRLETRPIVGN